MKYQRPMKTQTQPMTTNNDEDLVWYCTKCMSLNIKDKETKNGVTVPYCASCGADVYHIDVTSFDRWEELYTSKYGHKQIEFKTIYDDLTESYQEDAEEILSEHEAIENGLCVGDFIQRSNKTLKI